MCFESISEAAGHSVVGPERLAPIPCLRNRRRKKNFWRVRETRDTKGFADSAQELLGTAKNTLQRFEVLHDVLHFNLIFFDAALPIFVRWTGASCMLRLPF